MSFPAPLKSGIAEALNTLSKKQVLLRLRRQWALKFGNPSYCRVGAWALIDELFHDKPPGVFFEAGAHDGWTGSNSYWLEARYGWKGVLVEPVPGLYHACRRERPRARVFHGALVDGAFRESFIEVECSGLVSAVVDSPLVAESRENAEGYYGVKERAVARVPALTIDDCLLKAGCERLDFVSLDVEGYEVAALGGLDLIRWQPQYLLIECNQRQEVIDFLAPHYLLEREIAPRDILFRRRK